MTQIRRITESDAEHVATLHEQEYPTPHVWDIARDWEHERIVNMFRGVASGEKNFCFVADSESGIQGWITGTRDGVRAELHEPITVDGDDTNTLARQLVEHAMDYLTREHQFDMVRVHLPGGADEGGNNSKFRRQSESFWHDLGWRRDVTTFSWYPEEHSEADPPPVRIVSLLLLEMVYRETPELALETVDSVLMLTRDGQPSVTLGEHLRANGEYAKDLANMDIAPETIVHRLCHMAGIRPEPGAEGTIDIDLHRGQAQVTFSVHVHTADHLTVRLVSCDKH